MADSKTKSQTDDVIQNLRQAEQFRASNRQAQRHVERGYFGILGRQNVKFNSSTKKYELTFYSNDNPHSSRTIPLSDISTERSEADISYKFTIVAVNIVILLACALAPFANEIFTFLSEMDVVSDNLSVEMIELVVAATLVAFFALLSRSVENHLVHVDADWTNAINEAFNYTDVFVQMGGIRRLLLKFRQFIKWRRFVNFFLPIFATFSLALIASSMVVSVLYFSLEVNELARLIHANYGIERRM